MITTTIARVYDNMNVFYITCLVALLHQKRVICQEVVTQLCMPLKAIIPSVSDDVDVHSNSTSGNLHCECTNESSSSGLLFVRINCQDMKFTYVNFEVEKLPTVTKWLDMSWNEFEFVPKFIGSDLANLDMSHNLITTIDDNNFSKVENLKELNLSWNKIEMLSINAFDRLKSLLKLDMSRNLFKKITTNLFSTLPSLTHLILSRNRFLNETFSAKDVDLFITLGATTKLKILEIEEADLTEIDLSHGVGLKVIKLNCNQFDVIPDIPRGVEVFDFSANPLRTIETKHIPHLMHLRELYFNDMPRLTSIQEFAFFGLPKLQTVSFQGSWKLTFFSGLAFGDDAAVNETIINLEVLNLRGTSLKYIDATLAPALQKIKKFNLNGNPLICNCDIKWIKNCGVETDGQCFLPYELRGSKLSDISESDLNCRRWSAWVYKVLNGLIILVLLVLCGVATWFIVMGLRPSRRKHLQKIGAASPYARVTIEPNRAEDVS